MPRQIIRTDQAPAAIGPYSQGTVAGDFIFTAGQIALDPASGAVVGDTPAAQTRQALQNAGAVVEAAGGNLGDVVKVTIFIRDMDAFAQINEVYAEWIAENQPARSVVEVSRLPKDVLVEVELIAYRGD